MRASTEPALGEPVSGEPVSPNPPLGKRLVGERLMGEYLDADVCYFADFLSDGDATVALKDITSSVPWRQEHLTIYGTTHAVPRLSAWYGDPGTAYSYSGIRHEPLPWTSPLATMRDRVQATSGAPFNAVLVNLYRDGSDSNGWHADDEPELGSAPTIASVSLGATRRFRLRRTAERSVTHSVDLQHGSLLVMGPPTQAVWQHTLTKTAREVGPRVNLTFRLVVPENERVQRHQVQQGRGSDAG